MIFSLVSLGLLTGTALAAKNTQRNLQARSSYLPLHARQVPANATGVQTITTPQNVTIRYKEPGLAGVCETTPGVNSYSGYIDLDRFVSSCIYLWISLTFSVRHIPSFGFLKPGTILGKLQLPSG